jgi:shikimate dehydrogenase
MTMKAGVIGWPIAHSRSPLIHGTWLKDFGIDGTYDRWPVKPEELGAFFEKLKQQNMAGCNVTIPHKEQAFQFIDDADERAARIGAINTVWREGGKLRATSTDGVGFCDNVEQQHRDFTWRDRNVLILGAGGSAVAIADEILRRGAARICVANRSLERAESLARKFGASVEAHVLADLPALMPHAHLIVNTTSLGMTGEPSLDLDIASLQPDAIVADIVYVPLKTALLTAAENRGLRIVTGLGMLLHQAVPGFERWFGRKPAVTPELYDLIARDIDPGYTSP